MRKLGFLLVLCGALVAETVLAGEAQGLDTFVQESRGTVKTFAGQLKGELQAAIKEGGPKKAITVCNAKAPEIAGALSKPGTLSVGRTSLKLRNTANTPDAWETATLQEFLTRAAAGEDLKTMEKVELVKTDGQATYRYMKAIPTGEVCLACHGTNIEPDLQAHIDTLYPQDQATGFTPGMLRGAFTISKTATN